jgi:hypothetical protein
MSKVKTRREFKDCSPVPKSRRWTGFGLWTLDFGLLLVLCAVTVTAQENKCALKLAELPDAPELSKFHMSMTKEQAKARVPQIAFKPDNVFGVAKTSISPDFDPHIDKTGLEGVRTISLDFLDGRLTSLWLGYDGSFKWQTVPDFVSGISRVLHLPDAWQPWKDRGQQLKCTDFQMTVAIVSEGPSFHIIDQAAEKTIAARRQAKEEADTAAEEAAAAEIVGDKKNKVYYSESCLPGSEIKEADRVIFKSKEAAENAGYKPAKACQ